MPPKRKFSLSSTRQRALNKARRKALQSRALADSSAAAPPPAEVKVERSENSNSLSITPLQSPFDTSSHSSPTGHGPAPTGSLKADTDVVFHPILGGKAKSGSYGNALKSRNAPPPLPKIKDRRPSDASDTIVYARNHNSRRKQSTPCRAVN